MFNFTQYEELKNPAKLRAIIEGIMLAVKQDKDVRLCWIKTKQVGIKTKDIGPGQTYKDANVYSEMYSGTKTPPSKTSDFYMIVRLAWKQEEKEEDSQQ